MNSLSVSRIHYNFIIVFAISHNLGQYTMTSQSCSRISYSLSISRIKFEFTFCFVYRLWIHYLFREFTINWLSFCWIHYEFNLCFAIWFFFNKFDPSLTSDDFLWPDSTSNNLEFQFPTKFQVETFVYLIYFDQRTRFDPYWTGLTQIWPLMTLFDPEKYKIWILEKILSRNICISDIFQLIGPIWPQFHKFDPNLTSDDPYWPWKISNLNSWENSESKHMHVGYISTNPPNLTLIRQFDPSLTSGDL